MTRCPPSCLTDRLRISVRAFFADVHGNTICPITGSGDVHIAHIDDDSLHSQLHNLIPLKGAINNYLQGVARRLRTSRASSVPCELAMLELGHLRRQAKQHQDEWRYRSAYACVRIAYYVHSHYFGADTSTLCQLLAECLYYARHVWHNDLLWGLLDHDLVPLLDSAGTKLNRAALAPILRELSAIWADAREVAEAEKLLSALPDARSNLAIGKASTNAVAFSIHRRRGMVEVAKPDITAWENGLAHYRQALGLAKNVEQQINAEEVMTWGHEARGDWTAARTLLEPLEKKVTPWLEDYHASIQRAVQPGAGRNTLLKIPPFVTPLNTVQIPIEYAASLVLSGRPTPEEKGKARGIVDLTWSVYGRMRTRPFFLTNAVRDDYKRLATILGDKRLAWLAKGRNLSECTRKALMKASDLAVTRFRESRN